MRYAFEYDKINSCYDCPLYHDRCECSLDLGRSWSIADYDAMRSVRPDWCRLEEAPGATGEAGA